jgi:hypothetical protein
MVVEVRWEMSSFFVDLKEIRQVFNFLVQQHPRLMKISGLMFLRLRSGELISSNVSSEATPPIVEVEGRPSLEATSPSALVD